MTPAALTLLAARARRVKPEAAQAAS